MKSFPLQIKPICFKKDFSGELNALAEERWAMFIQECGKKNLSLPENSGIPAVLKKIFVFSGFVAKRSAPKSGNAF